jgi:hypothetical protein
VEEREVQGGNRKEKDNKKKGKKDIAAAKAAVEPPAITTSHLITSGSGKEHTQVKRTKKNTRNIFHMCEK